LAPGQEWRTVWDSAISREELGGAIRSRFDGALTYSDRPRPGGAKTTKSGAWHKQDSFETKFRLDWATLQPVQRIELLTTHDLAKREKQKLELLRSVLTYFHYASKETQPDVFRAEIGRMNKPWRKRRIVGGQGNWTRPPSSISVDPKRGGWPPFGERRVSTIGSSTCIQGRADDKHRCL
jgi:hypothetical protein